MADSLATAASNAHILEKEVFKPHTGPGTPIIKALKRPLEAPQDQELNTFGSTPTIIKSPAILKRGQIRSLNIPECAETEMEVTLEKKAVEQKSS